MSGPRTPKQMLPQQDPSKPRPSITPCLHQGPKSQSQQCPHMTASLKQSLSLVGPHNPGQTCSHQDPKLKANFRSPCWTCGHQNPQSSGLPHPHKDTKDRNKPAHFRTPKPRTNLPKAELQISRVTMTVSEPQILW